MNGNVMVVYDEKSDSLKIVVDDCEAVYGEDFPGGVVFRGIEDGAVAGVLLQNVSKVIGGGKAAQRKDEVVSGVLGEKVDAARGNAVGRKACVYTDGSCLKNPGPGGWASIVEVDGKAVELSGGEAQTTNNRMELISVISALEFLTEPTIVTVCSDSQYVVNGIEKGWAKNWRQHRWIKSDGKAALNPELWDRLLQLCEYHTVKFQWVKGHAGNPRNERCDKLARGEAMKAQRKGNVG